MPDQAAVQAACERLERWMAASHQLPPNLGENLKVLREYQAANTTAHDDIRLLIAALSDGERPNAPLAIQYLTSSVAAGKQEGVAGEGEMKEAGEG